MAVIYKNFPGIEKKLNSESRLRIKQILIFAISMVLLLVYWQMIAPKMKSDELAAIILSIWAAINAILFFVFWRREKQSKERSAIYTAGLQGEMRTLSVLQLLDKQHIVIPNATVSFSGQSSEMDAVVIGPSGVFIVETKNHRGFIQGDTAAQQLTQITQDRYGNRFSQSFYNPCRQVATHAYRLKSVLKERGLDTWVNTCVFFSNPEACLNITNNTNQNCPVFHEPNQLLAYLTQGQAVLQPETIQQITQCILAFAKKE